MAKVLHIYKTYMPFTMGGVEQVIQQLALSTASAGFTHQVLTLHEGEDFQRIQRPEAEVLAVPWRLHLQSTPLSFQYLRRFRKLAQEADIVHYHHPFPLQDIAQALSGIATPSLVTYHSDVVRQKWANKLYSPLLNHFLGKVDLIVASSPQYRQSSSVLQRFQAKTSVVPFGLSEASYPEPDSATVKAYRERFKQGFFLFVGVLRYYKGLEFLIEAARKTGLPVVVAGDGPERKNIEQAADNIENLHYLGQISESEKVALLNLASAFVFPSSQRSEAFGISLLEAAMHGKALISAEIGTGTSLINQHEETGLIVPPANAQALADAMIALWQDDERRQQMGDAARARYLSHFTSEDMGRAYARAYQQLLAPQDKASEMEKAQ